MPRSATSIAVNGCCLTVVALGEGCFAADAVTETLGRTELGTLAPGDRVNLERPVRLQDRLGGHLVQGHVDAVGRSAAAPRKPTVGARQFAAPEAVWATSSRRARSPSTASASPWRPCRTTGSRSPSSAHPRGHDPRHQSARCRGEPRSRHCGEIRGTFTEQSRRLRNPRCRSQRSSKPSRPSGGMWEWARYLRWAKRDLPPHLDQGAGALSSQLTEGHRLRARWQEQRLRL